MGAGRSGSTILGVILGNCTDVFFAGELDKWVPRAGEPKRKDARRADFWRNVRSRMAEPDVLFGKGAHQYLERSSALLRFRRRAARRRLQVPYRRLMDELYEAVSATAGVSYIVDTSHYPLRARELQSLNSIDLYLLLLTRDPQDVIASFAKDDVAERSFNSATTRAYLLFTYLVSAWVFLKHPPARRLVVQYEDLLEDPTGVLRALLDYIGSPAELPELDSLATGIPLHGNRLLDADVVSLQQGRTRRGTQSLGGRLWDGLLLGWLTWLRPRVRPCPKAGSSPRARILAR